MDKKVIKIEFETEAQAADFATFMCEQGEQDYDNWVDCQDDETLANNFNYHNTKIVDGKKVYGKFMETGVIKATRVE